MTLLSICVPSFNDSAMLQKTLDNLLSIAEIPNIEVVISDNNSTDNSREVLASFDKASQGRFIEHVQKSNLGFRGNIAFLSSVATGDYVWFLGIGECINHAAIAPILEALNRYKPTNFVVSGIVSNELSPFSGSLTVVSSKDEPSTPLFSETISLNIIKRELALTSLQQGSSASGDYWPHLEAILEARGHEKERANSLFAAEPIVSISPNLDGWWFDRDGAYNLSLAQIEILAAHDREPVSTPWLKRRLYRMRAVGLGEIILRSRKNGKEFSGDELNTIRQRAKLGLWLQIPLILAAKTPLRIFAVLAPIARRLKL